MAAIQITIMSQNYTTFKKYPDVTEAKSLQQYLIENGIECLFIDNSPRMGSSFSGGDLLKEYEIQLKPDDFERATELLEKRAEGFLDEIPEDYYLLTFTDEELHDVIVKKDEWSEFDYLLAKHLLAQKGKTIDHAQVKQLQDKRIAELAKPEADKKGLIITGYILSLLGGFFGIITGYVLYTSHKTLPNGASVPTYSKGDRAHGKIMMVLGIVVLVSVGLIKILKLL